MSCVSEACRNLFFSRREREALSDKLGNLAMGIIELEADRITGQTVMHAAPGIRCRAALRLGLLLRNQGHLVSFTSFPVHSD